MIIIVFSAMIENGKKYWTFNEKQWKWRAIERLHCRARNFRQTIETKIRIEKNFWLIFDHKYLINWNAIIHSFEFMQLFIHSNSYNHLFIRIHVIIYSFEFMWSFIRLISCDHSFIWIHVITYSFEFMWSFIRLIPCDHSSIWIHVITFFILVDFFLNQCFIMFDFWFQSFVHSNSCNHSFNWIIIDFISWIKKFQFRNRVTWMHQISKFVRDSIFKSHS